MRERDKLIVGDRLGSIFEALLVSSQVPHSQDLSSNQQQGNATYPEIVTWHS